jgi:hypothetical protein
MLSIASLVTPPFEKVCGNCHVIDVTIFLACGVYCNTHCSKSIFQKLGFLRGFTITNNEHVLLIIKGKWLEAIMHIIESEFLDLPHLKQVQLLISIDIYGNFLLVDHIYPC